MLDPSGLSKTVDSTTHKMGDDMSEIERMKKKTGFNGTKLDDGWQQVHRKMVVRLIVYWIDWKNKRCLVC